MKDGRHPAFGTYNYIGTNIPNGSLTFDDAGTASIQLKHNQAIEIQGIPDGYTYTITEAADELYTAESTGSSGTIHSGETSAASFVNTRKSANIVVTKTVRGNMGNRDKKFMFELYVIDSGRELNGNYNISIAHDNSTVTNDVVTFVDGAITFELEHGDVATISGLPVAARFEVDELAASRVGYQYEATIENGTIPEGGVTSAWTNTRGMIIPTGIHDVYGAGQIIVAMLVLTLMTGIVLCYRKKKYDC